MTRKISPKSKAPKVRLDQALVERGLAENRAKAKALVMAGLVFCEDVPQNSPGTQVRPDIPLTVKGPAHPWVSRGGLKLKYGLEHFNFDVVGRTCLDIGASTGGFTDVLLERGAAKVFAVDVGYGQLADKLRTNPKVVVLERTNARYLTQALVPEPIDAVVCDASFIGLRTVLPAGLSLTKPIAWSIALIKPQFEVGKDRVGKKGVVRDPKLHDEVCATISDWMKDLPGWKVEGIVPSPIEGPEGNIEFLIGASRNPKSDL